MAVVWEGGRDGAGYLHGGVQTGAASVPALEHAAQHKDAGARTGRGDSRVADPSKGSVLGRGDSVSFALHVPRAVLSLCPSCEGIPGQLCPTSRAAAAQAPMPSLCVCV